MSQSYARVEKQRYTYDDYCSWQDDKRWELIDGVPYAMSAPTVRHQRIAGRLFTKFFIFLDGKPCEAFIAPLDVILNPEGEKNIVVQPDIIVVCDSSKLDDKACRGTPDLIIEILSPSTSSIDTVVKFNRYQEAGVKEYWIVNPESNWIQVFRLNDGVYNAHTYGEEDTIPVGIIEDFEINLQEIFE